MKPKKSVSPLFKLIALLLVIVVLLCMAYAYAMTEFAKGGVC